MKYRYSEVTGGGMNVDGFSPEFFLHATGIICGSTDMHRMLHDLLAYLSGCLPLDALALSRFEEDQIRRAPLCALPQKRRGRRRIAGKNSRRRAAVRLRSHPFRQALRAHRIRRRQSRALPHARLRPFPLSVGRGAASASGGALLRLRGHVFRAGSGLFGTRRPGAGTAVHAVHAFF